MKDYWARKIVDETYNMITVNSSTTILMNSERQSRFLHLQKQCYWDCPYCEIEAKIFKDIGR